ncbi:hypothetical protein [Streptomyces sp. NPDC058145]|uniref:hypothetical protein n=1 Tax=Streptomyces sp. NPDC058145 TaxID=3346356 RepID=UPI0036E29677
MGFTAIHADWRRLDASLDDLRCGRAWADVHRVKGQQLVCPECRGQVFARLSPHRARHFYHQERPPEGELAHEPPEHHLLKLQLVTTARAAPASAAGPPRAACEGSACSAPANAGDMPPAGAAATRG